MKYRRKITALTVASLLLVIAYLHLSSHQYEIFDSTLPSKFHGSYDFVQHRGAYVNPQYQNSFFEKHTDGEPSEASCKAYFKNIELFDLEYYQKFHFDKTLLKKRKWISNKEIEWKKELLKIGHKFDRATVGPMLDNEYEKEINALSTFELHLRNVLSHLRVQLRCPNSEAGEKLLRSLLTAEGLAMGNNDGNGLVIPMYENVSIFTYVNLIHVLRGLKNELPIEIFHYEMEDGDHKILENAAHRDLMHIPHVFENIHDREFNGIVDFPEQKLQFIQLEKPETATLGDNYLFAKASLLNSFKIATLLHPDIIPVTEDFASQVVEANEEFKKTGIFFFQQPAWTHTKKRRVAPGFHEMNNFIHNFLLPQEADTVHFGIRPTESSTIKRKYFGELFSQILDHSMVVINKEKHKYTLYVHLFLSLIQQNEYLEARLCSGSSLNLELLWLSLEILGLPSLINVHAGVAVGVVTPPELANYTFTKTTRASEICSSSWGQVSEFNDRLIYVQNYQLINWQYGQAFQNSVQRKYLIKGEPVDVFRTKLQISPLTIETALLPPFVVEPVFDNGEPSQGWYAWESFSEEMIFPYYCAYNVVGDASSGRFGRSFDLDTTLQNKLSYYMHLWMGIP